MVDDRFFMQGYSIWDSQNDNRRVSTKTAYKLLNELYKENKTLREQLNVCQIKKQNKDLIKKLGKRLIELNEENKELKEENQELLSLIQEDVESWSDEYKQAICDISNAIFGDFE